MSRILIVVGGLFVGLIVLGAIVGPKQFETGTPVEPVAAQPVVAQPAPPASEPIIDVTADQLYKDYARNEVRADSLYRGKVLRVVGTVKAIKRDITDYPYIELWTPDQFNSVRARFPKEALAALSELVKNQRVAIGCRGDNVILDSPQLQGCILLNE